MNFTSYFALIFVAFVAILVSVQAAPAIKYVTVYQTIRVHRSSLAASNPTATAPAAEDRKITQSATQTAAPAAAPQSSQAITSSQTPTQTAPTFSAVLPTTSPAALKSEIPITTVAASPTPSNRAETVGQLLPSSTPSTSSGPAGSCKFPWAAGNSDNVVPITPDQMNGGWAMSPDQSCKEGQWCPYACAPGYYSTQWDPSATAYNGPGSMNGGLFCGTDGVLKKPFTDKPYCALGMNNAIIRNTLDKSVSACQTVYPGNEAMIIPSVAGAGSTTPLNIVPNTFWLGTSSQFYVNLAGSGSEQCIWGTPDKPVGNWGPYIFGGGQGKDGNTYISVQYNPLYTQSGFKATDAYNVKINCLQGSCNFPTGGECKCEGGKCSVDNGCTVTLSGDAKAEFVLY